MKRRRVFGYIFRRRTKLKEAGGGTRDGFRPGFYLRVRIHGRETTRYAGLTRDTAIAFAQRLARQSERRDLLGEEPRCETTFDEFAGTYLEYALQSMTEASFIGRRRLVRAILVPYFRGRPLDEITGPEIQRFLASRGSVTGATRNRALTAISAMYRRAIDLGLLTTNPARDVRRAKETRFPLTLVPDSQVDMLLARLEQPQRTFFFLLVESGLRLSEALRLEWADLDFGIGTIHVRVSKAKRPRIVAMTSALRRALFELSQRRTLSITAPGRVFSLAMGEDHMLRYSSRSSRP
jgi:integrase